MKMSLKLSGAFLALSLASVGCGGVDDILGSKCPASGPALTSGAVTYTTVASNIADSCNVPPLAASELAGNYKITTDTSSCGATLTGPNGGVFGQGTANSGTFMATFTGVVSEASLNPPGPCQYNRTITSNVTLTSDTSVTVDYSETQNNFMTAVGGSGACTPPAGGSCAIAYTLTMTKSQ